MPPSRAHLRPGGVWANIETAGGVFQVCEGEPEPRVGISAGTPWNAEHQAVEFGVEIGEYRGVVRVPRRVFQRLLPERPTPQRCVEAYYLQRTRFESIAERKLRRREVARTAMPRSRLRFAKSLGGDRTRECLKSLKTSHLKRTFSLSLSL